MKTSETITEIFAAFALAQGEIIDAHKDRQGYGYKYADLGQVLQIVRPVLAKHGLSVVQDATVTDGAVSVATRICHASGQWIECGPLSMAIEPKKGLSQAQCVGTVVTYARRYGLTAAIGITQDDTDASMEAPRPPASLELVRRALSDSKDAELFVLLSEMQPAEKKAVWAELTPAQHAHIKGVMTPQKEAE